MTAFNTANLRDLVGGWSCLTIAVGLAGAAISYFSLRVGRRIRASDKATAKVSAALAVAMLVFALFIGGFIVPLSMGYSGPAPEYVPIRLYDKYLAAVVALAFAVVFAFDTFWLSRSHSHSQ
jgi:hypothetical protein